MASLRDLVRTILPLARPAATDELTDEALDREVFWVRLLRARDPVVDPLDPGDLVIVPAGVLEVVAETLSAAESLGRSLAAARVSAAVIVDGGPGDDAVRGLSEMAAAMARAATSGGVTVLRTRHEDPVALERSVIGFLVNRRAELDRRAAALEAQLARLSLQAEGLDVLAAAIGAFLGRAVAIEVRRGDPIAVHAPAELPGGAAAVSRYLAKPSAVALRVPIPAPADEPAAGGRLALLGDEPPTELERIAGERIAAVLALELARNAAIREAREQSRRAEPLPTDGPPWVVIIARQVTTTAALGEAPLDAATRERTRAELRQLVPARRLSLRGTSDSMELRLVAAASNDDPDGLVIAARIAAFLGRPVAVSNRFGDPAERPAAEASARTTLEAIEGLDEPPTIGHSNRLPAYRLLANVRNLPDGARLARELLAPILVGREAVQEERLRTLLAVLGSASLADAAGRLGVHRNTLAYRIERLETIGGWDLADPDVRFALSLAARTLRPLR